MDLTNFDTRPASEAGVDINLVIDGEVIYGDDKKPVTFKVRGPADRRVQAYLLKLHRKPASSNPDDGAASDIAFAKVAVLGWSNNFEVGGEKLKYSEEAIGIIMENPVVRRAVISEVMKEANFMPKR